MTVTNDGATILKAIGVDNPAAKVLVGEVGRGLGSGRGLGKEGGGEDVGQGDVCPSDCLSFSQTCQRSRTMRWATAPPR